MSGTGDAKEDLISSVPMGPAVSRIDYEGGEDIAETVRTRRGLCGSYDLGGEGMGDSCEIGDSNIASDAADQDADEEGLGVTNANQSSWTRRVRVGKAADEREPSPSRMPALEAFGGVVLKQNIPIEVQASQVYTRTMFGEALYECGLYDLVEVKPHLEYIARNIKFQSREKWCKNEFVISVSESADEFRCECGTFERHGMVCSHALKVMIHLKLHEFPAKHVLKRWTRDARDILPSEYLRYQKDHGRLKYSSRRRNTLYLVAFDAVKLGDSNVEGYALAMEKMRDVKVLVEPVAAMRDGLGLSDIELATDSAVFGIGNKQHFGRTESEHTISQGSDVFPTPSRRRPAGRPTTSHDKAPYEEPSKRSRSCSVCRVQRHKSTTCLARGDVPMAPRKSPRCSKCGLTGHKKNTCSNPVKVLKNLILVLFTGGMHLAMSPFVIRNSLWNELRNKKTP